MPILQVKISEAPSEALTQAVTVLLLDTTTRILRKRPELMAITIDYVAPEHWIVGGKSLREQEKRSFFLDIKVVDGTNTKDEKARYVAETFAGFERLLGPLHGESYVYVHDVRADAYGYGGRTQEYRYVEAQR